MDIAISFYVYEMNCQKTAALTKSMPMGMKTGASI